MNRAKLVAASFFACVSGTSFGVDRADELSSTTVPRPPSAEQVYWVEQLVEGLDFPSAIAWLPNGEMLIAERMGNVRVVRGGMLDPQPLSGVPQSYHSIYDGIKDIAVDPDFASNRSVYLYLSEGSFESRRAAVYRATLSKEGLTDLERIFSSSEGVGGGAVSIVSRMTFLKDKTLLFAVAEDHAQARAQELDSHMGKLLRINRDGSVPDDNPFRNTSGALPEIYSYGHRIPLGLYQEPQSGQIWEVEPGPRGGDELNLLKAGANYGWARASWGFAYKNRGLEAPLQSGPGIEDPVLVWMPSSTPSGITRYRGSVYPAWDGDYFVGMLSSKALVRLRIKNQQVVLQERLLIDLGERIRDVKEGPDHLLYLLTDHQNGRLLRIRAGQPLKTDRERVARKLETPMTAPTELLPKGGEERLEAMSPRDFSHGRQSFLERCAGCHRIGTAIPGGDLGPDLAGLYNSLMGRKDGFDYSPAMAGGLIPWNFATLNQFLAGPQTLVPGTTMTAPPVSDAQTRRNLIGFLKQQSGK